MNDKPRRNPLDKERFGEGNRQKWAMVFIGVGLFSLLVAAVNPFIDIAPFMVYFTAIAATADDHTARWYIIDGKLKDTDAELRLYKITQ